MKRLLLNSMYRLGGFAPFQWANRDKVLILMYHGFSRDEHPYKISAAEFAAHLDHLGGNHRVLPLDEAVEYLQNGKSLPPNTAVITIDDGYADAYEIAFPLLKAKRMPATVYAVTDFVDGNCWMWTDLMRYVLTETQATEICIDLAGETINAVLPEPPSRWEVAGRINSRLKQLTNDAKAKEIIEIARSLGVEIPEKPVQSYSPITWDQAREMDAENVRIESHTVTHPILTNINASHLEAELNGSKKRLEEVLERRVEHFCYPNGSYNEPVREAVENAGYRSATTTNYGFNANGAELFTMKRIDAHAGIANFAQSVSGFEAFRSDLGRLARKTPELVNP